MVSGRSRRRALISRKGCRLGVRYAYGARRLRLLTAVPHLPNVAKIKPKPPRNIPKDPALRLEWWIARIEELRIRLEHAEVQRELTRAMITHEERRS